MSNNDQTIETKNMTAEQVRERLTVFARTNGLTDEQTENILSKFGYAGSLIVELNEKDFIDDAGSKAIGKGLFKLLIGSAEATQQGKQPCTQITAPFAQLSLGSQSSTFKRMEELLANYMNDDSDLVDFHELDITDANNLDKVKRIVSRELGFKMRVSKAKFTLASVFSSAIPSYVEIGEAELTHGVFDLEFQDSVSSILHHSSKWNFRSSEHENIPIYATLFDEVLTSLSKLDSSCIVSISRNITENTATSRALRPDLICMVNSVLLFKGEEKAENNKLQTAIAELPGKFDKSRAKVSYAKLPIILGYAAAGNHVTITALQVSDMIRKEFSKPSHRALEYFDLEKPLDRILLLRAVINIYRLMRYCARNNLIVADRSLNLFAKINKGNTTIANMQSFIKKTMTIDPEDKSLSRIDFNELSKVYAKLKTLPGDPNITKIIKTTNSANSVTLHIKPVCYAHKITQLDDMLASIRDVLDALSELHDANVIHRDIRWSNVLYDGTRRRFLLTDFEHSRLLASDKDYALVNEEFQYIPIEMLESDKSGHKMFDKQADILMLGMMIKRLGDPDIVYQDLEQITIEIENRESLKLVHDLGEKIVNNWKTIKISDILEQVNKMISDNI